MPIGAWHGNGRKVGWFSPFLLAAYDPDTEEFQSVCRCMSGYTDAFYAEVGFRATPPKHEGAEVCAEAHTLLAGPESRVRQADILQAWQEQTGSSVLCGDQRRLL